MYIDHARHAVKLLCEPRRGRGIMNTMTTRRACMKFCAFPQPLGSCRYSLQDLLPARWTCIGAEEVRKSITNAHISAAYIQYVPAACVRTCTCTNGLLRPTHFLLHRPPCTDDSSFVSSWLHSLQEVPFQFCCVSSGLWWRSTLRLLRISPSMIV